MVQQKEDKGLFSGKGCSNSGLGGISGNSGAIKREEKGLKVSKRLLKNTALG